MKILINIIGIGATTPQNFRCSLHANILWTFCSKFPDLLPKGSFEIRNLNIWFPSQFPRKHRKSNIVSVLPTEFLKKKIKIVAIQFHFHNSQRTQSDTFSWNSELEIIKSNWFTCSRLIVTRRNVFRWNFRRKLAAKLRESTHIKWFSRVTSKSSIKKFQ